MRLRERRSLWWFAVVILMWVVAIPFVNRIDPVVLGLPMLAWWVVLAILVSPLAMWIGARRDPLFVADEAELADGEADAG